MVLCCQKSSKETKTKNFEESRTARLELAMVASSQNEKESDMQLLSKVQTQLLQLFHSILHLYNTSFFLLK